MVRARFFDGRTSRAREVVLRPQGARLVVEGEGIRLEVAPDEVRVGEPLARAGRTLGLPGGAHCEVEPGPDLDLLLELLGHREGRVSRWQRSLRVALACTVATLGLFLPWAEVRTARWRAARTELVPGGSLDAFAAGAAQAQNAAADELAELFGFDVGF